jgi:hypothetical protein
MPIQIVSDAILQCSFGAALSALQTIPISRVMAASVARTAPLNQLLLT